MHDKIQKLKDKGKTHKQVEAILGIKIPEEIEPVTVDPTDTSDDVIRAAARVALLRIVQNENAAQSAVVSACRELLDRVDGKAIQSVSVESKHTVTIDHVQSLPPAEAYRMLIEGHATVIDSIDPPMGVNK